MPLHANRTRQEGPSQEGCAGQEGGSEEAGTITEA